ncbi:MAG: hypothetical protein AB201_01610 [Parcubacteria bacterium C7867-006]|nr:MAG: hypothetical protein AB201_01610 [Parcubacteria bacterium C7867-006]
MSIFSFGNEKEKVSLVIDVGSSTVTSAMVVFNAEELPTFLYSKTATHPVGDKADANRLIESLLSILDLQLKELVKEGFNHKYWNNKSKKLSGGIISFSSPWFAIKTKHLSLSHEKDFIVTESFLNDVISQEENIFKSELYPERPDAFEVIEKNVLHTKINGYELQNILDKKTKSLEAFLCMSAMDVGLVYKIQDIVLRYAHIHKDDFKFHTFPVVSFAVVRDFFSAGGDFLICDVSGDVTDLTLVQDFVIKQNVSIPSGRNFILRQISKNFDVTPEIAESMLHMFSSDKSDDSVNQKMHEVIAEIEKEWAIYLENALVELSPTINLPSNIYLMSDSDVVHIYTEFLKMPKTDTTSIFRKMLNINIIDEIVVSKFIKNQAVGKIDEFITFVALFYKKLINTK